MLRDWAYQLDKSVYEHGPEVLGTRLAEALGGDTYLTYRNLAPLTRGIWRIVLLVLVFSAAAMALLMGAEADKPAEDDMSEEKLLRALMEAQEPK